MFFQLHRHFRVVANDLTRNRSRVIFSEHAQTFFAGEGEQWTTPWTRKLLYSSKPGRTCSSSFIWLLSLYLLNSKSNRERWELSFTPMLEFDLLIIQTPKIKLRRDEFTSCKSLIYWSFKPQKLNLCNNSSLTKKKIENCQFRRVKPQLHHLTAAVRLDTRSMVKAFPLLTKPWWILTWV